MLCNLHVAFFNKLLKMPLFTEIGFAKISPKWLAKSLINFKDHPRKWKMAETPSQVVRVVQAPPLLHMWSDSATLQDIYIYIL